LAASPPRPVAYLTTQYPAVSHSFIRREILAMEAAGQPVLRLSVRPPHDNLPDPDDRSEAGKTSVILNGNWARLFGSALLQFVIRPASAVRALACTIGMARKSGGEWIRHGAYFLEACWVNGVVRQAGAIHMHVHFGHNAASVARIVRTLGGPPFSFTVHGPAEFDHPEQIDLGGKIADSAFCVAISSYGRSQLMRWCPVEQWPKIEVVRCGVDALFTDQRDSSPPPATPELSCVARLSGQKGLPLLIDAAARLAASGRAFRLTIAGDGEMRSEIEAQIAHHKLQEHVVLLGSVSAERVRELILSSRAMVLPSFAEGLPVVIMEALALERPVISTAIAGIPELVDSACGWLIPAGDIDALVTAMDDAIRADQDRLVAMGRTGRQRVLDQHRADTNALQLLALIRRLPAPLA
jgi:colanic acid/amylovoran biosynthesis glycosyltransferase